MNPSPLCAGLCTDLASTAGWVGLASIGARLDVGLGTTNEVVEAPLGVATLEGADVDVARSDVGIVGVDAAWGVLFMTSMPEVTAVEGCSALVGNVSELGLEFSGLLYRVQVGSVPACRVACHKHETREHNTAQPDWMCE